MEGAIDIASLGPGGIPSSQEEAQQRQAQMAQQEEQRKGILDQILDSAASDRLKRLNLVRKDKARAVEDSLVKAAMSGQLKNKVTDEQLIQMLEQVGGGEGGEGGGGRKAVQVQRRNYGMESDDDDNDDDLM